MHLCKSRHISAGIENGLHIHQCPYVRACALAHTPTATKQACAYVQCCQVAADLLFPVYPCLLMFAACFRCQPQGRLLTRLLSSESILQYSIVANFCLLLTLILLMSLCASTWLSLDHARDLTPHLNRLGISMMHHKLYLCLSDTRVHKFLLKVSTPWYLKAFPSSLQTLSQNGCLGGDCARDHPHHLSLHLQEHNWSAKAGQWEIARQV